MTAGQIRLHAAKTPKASRRRLVCLGLLTTIVPTGLAWRFAPLHLPPFAYKYGGSALWALAVYWLVAAYRPLWPSAAVAGTAATLSVAVECFKLVRAPALDQFRATLAGKILLGRHFTFGAMAAYLLAISGVFWLDQRYRPDKTQEKWLVSGHSHL